MHICKFCKEEFPGGDELADHLTDEHDAFSAVTEMAIDLEAPQ